MSRLNLNNDAKFQAVTDSLSPSFSISNTGGSVPDANLESFLGLTTGALDTLVGGNATEGSAASYTVTAKVGDTFVFSFDYQTYENLDNYSFNDTAFLSVSSVGFTDIKLVADTFSTDVDGYQAYTYTFTKGGTFTIGLGIVDVGDTIVDSSLHIENAALNGSVLTPSELVGVVGGTEGNDVLSGDDGNNTLYGYGGNDTLNGKLGNDGLYGGLGNDTYLVAKNDGVDIIDDAGGTDVLKFTDLADTGVTETSRTGINGNDLLLKYGASQVTIQSYFSSPDTRIEQFQFSNSTAWGWADIKAKVLKATAGDDMLYGYEDSDDTLNGLAGNDGLYGYGGNDTLDGGVGNDALWGGTGNDSYLVDSPGDTVYEGYNDGGIDSVSSSVDFTLLGTAAYAENLTLLAGAVKALGNNLDNTLTGNAAANALTGLDGNDILIGGDGNDSLQGGAGNDSLNGGNGVDFVQYWMATAGVTVNLSLVAAQNTGGAGTDTLASIENLNGSGFNDTLTGNAQNNSLLGGVGDDMLNGGDGNDGLQGGLGNDTLNGGNGIDWGQYYLATAGVTVNLSLTTAQNTVGAGTDTLSNLENVNGSGFNDTLTGNAGINTLVGGAGNDSLNGGLGNDLLTGGAGQDSFVFSTALGISNKDIVTDFSVADDTVKLENAVFTALTTTGTLSAAAFKVIGAGASVDADDRILYNTATGGVLYDADGNGASAAVLVAVIGKSLAVTASDFFVI